MISAALVSPALPPPTNTTTFRATLFSPSFLFAQPPILEFFRVKRQPNEKKNRTDGACESWRKTICAIAQPRISDANYRASVPCTSRLLRAATCVDFKMTVLQVLESPMDTPAVSIVSMYLYVTALHYFGKMLPVMRQKSTKAVFKFLINVFCKFPQLF